jgi:4-hydroxybenzoate polyprenyltransferase
VTLRDALVLGRVSNLPTVWSNVVAGAALGGASVSPAWAAVLVALSLFYTGGMYLNDAFDRHVDARERPERPIPAGRASPAVVFAAGYAMLLGGTVLLGMVGGPGGALGGIALGVLVVIYDAHHKESRWSPLVMGGCRAMVYLSTAAALTGALPGAVWIGAAMLVAYLVGLTYAAKEESRGRLRRAWPLLLTAAPLVWLAPRLLSRPTLLLPYAAFAGWMVVSLRLLLRRDAPDVRGGVVRLIAGIALLDALLCADAGRWPLACAAALALPLTRFLQRHVPGT